MLKMRFQVFSFSCKKVRGFPSDGIIVGKYYCRSFIFKAVSQFPEILISVWWTDMRCIVINIISNINVTIFQKEVTDVNIKKERSQYRILRYSEANLSECAIRAIYFSSFFPSFQIRINKIQGIFIKNHNHKVLLLIIHGQHN